jgi:hypothetical protein
VPHESSLEIVGGLPLRASPRPHDARRGERPAVPLHPDRSIGFRAQSTLSTIINVPIPASSTAQNSSILIRNALNAGLTADYSASIVGPNGDFVKLFRNTGTFTMSISENVPVQNMFEVTSVPVPALGPWGALILALGLVAIAAHALTRRRRSSENIA